MDKPKSEQMVGAIQRITDLFAQMTPAQQSTFLLSIRLSDNKLGKLLYVIQLIRGGIIEYLH